ncbi:hypothetical protein CHARACLAT_003600 [Characodon lateralis]|uniref:Rho guanine nucleotide exchange factor 15 n=1 Tax=Characodon lateralis TaxID=208331 RepID=A0ABU7EG33_9TELE|nr:hypothetical protein [Characodon lateralis]
MSVLERPTSPLKPEVKPKPEIPQRSLHSNSLCLVGGGCTSGTTQGKVKKIAKRFTQQDSSEAGEQLVNGAAALSSSKEGKKPPEIKPKPDNSSPQPQVGTEQAPPLPKKRSRFQNKKESIGGEDSDGMNVNKRRSAPDGKEVEAQGPGAAEAKELLYSPLSRCRNKTCTCMCHLKRPGMMLIWVPVDEHENEGPGGEGKAKVKVQREEMDVKGQKVEQGLKPKAAKKQMEVKPAEKEEEMHGEETEVRGQKAKSELDIQAAKEGEVKEAEKEMENENLEKKRELEEQKAENELEVNTTETEIELNAAQKEVEDYRAENGKICEGIKEVDDREEKNEAGDERDRAPVVDEKAVKSQFHQSLEILLAGGLRRRSDQDSQLPLAPYRPPPVQNQSLEDEEESIYELQLPEADQAAKKMSSARKDLQDIPQITISKPARQSKPANASDSTPELENTTEPPAIPPRVPVNDVPLPWNENNSGRTSPGSNPSFGRIRPPPPKTSPPCSPLSPRRPPPAPPKTDSRRASNTFMQSTILSGEENESNKEKEETEQSFNQGFQLNDEPLYQTYSDFAIRKELRRQTVIRSISKTSADYAMEWAARMNEKISGKSEGSGAAKVGPMPTVSQSTLWQDLPAVQDSGVLDQFTPDQIKYQESMFEVLTSEASYLRSLRVLTEHFMENRELGETLIISDKKTLFSNITKVREVSERFLKDLEDHIFKEIMFPDICDILNYHAQHNFAAYIDYIRNQSYQEKTYSRLMKTNEQFATVINRLQELPHCHRLPFISFLLLPFQRITRIKMLIENILKRTNEGTAEEQTASKALASVTKIIDQCNRDVGKMRQMEELIEISKMLEFDKLKAIPIISETRFLEKKGELQEMSKAKTFVNMRARFSVVYLFLFNDRLLITVKKGSDRYVVVDHTHRSLVQAQPLDECFGGAAYENCFNLVMLENHQGRMMERILKAPSKSDMQRWLAAFPSSTQEDIDEEVIYEDWDCPQVQCVEQYVAQQADELSLEPTEIVNVIRKTNEGWYEGSRLSDGQKGWFPDVNVIEITNEHVRRRNIKERYRVSQATRMVKSPKTR